MSRDAARKRALQIATERRPRAVQWPTDADGRHLAVRERLGRRTFSLARMRERMAPEVVARFEEAVSRGDALDAELADQVAGAALEWALEQGATHFTHWFQPMTGATAEKHDAFLAFDGDQPVSRFTGEQLSRSEPDASSFPSGGMRTTFEARGYTTWDPSSPMFVMQRTNGATLCIPSLFFSYRGAALDKKTPLLRSMQALERQALRLCGWLGCDEVKRVVPTAGPEQEYFLVDKAYVALRPDLLIAGRTLLGQPAPKGQTLEDHYFGSIPARVLAFMHELEEELYEVGVPALTRHNEVAPSQFELAVRFSEANLAADHNQLVMELLRKVAARHDFVALLHEKPFDGLNGSGKHLNWSLADDQGRNLLSPGERPEQDRRFLAFLTAVLVGVHRHAALLRASVASHGNDLRLGGHEAPPAVISVFLGEHLAAICDALADGRVAASRDPDTIELGLRGLAPIPKDNTDRNRTSPFAFTGDKFEFRAVGSNSSISFPLTVLNTVVADGLATLVDRLEAGGDLFAVLGAALAESAPVRFEGNNYAQGWLDEAAARGLPDLRTTPQALGALGSEQARALFSSHGVLDRAELESRAAIKLERYQRTVEIELDLLRKLIDQQVLPALIQERRAAAEDLVALRAVRGELDDEDIQAVSDLGSLLGSLRQARAALDQAATAAREPEGLAQAVLPAMRRLRRLASVVEGRVPDSGWGLPRISEMLFQS